MNTRVLDAGFAQRRASTLRVDEMLGVGYPMAQTYFLDRQ
jgi:hypothetical protein